MSSEGEISKDISAEVDKAPAENIDDNSSEDSQSKEVKSENEEKGNEKSSEAKVPSDIPSESGEVKDKKDSDLKKEVKGENAEEVKKDDKDKKIENNENKTDNDTEDGEDSNKEDDGSKKEGKKDVPLLDQPLQQSGSRERKKVQRFNEEFTSETKETKTEIPTGTGTQLGEIPRIDASISRFKNDDLKLLHRLLYKTPGKTTFIKKNIKKFNGFEFKKDSEEYTKKLDSAKKFELKQLKSICEMLDLEKKGVKDEIVQRIIDFLIEPKDSGKPVGGGRPKRTAAVRANNRGYSSHDDSYSSDERRTARGGRGKGKRTNLKDDTTSESDEDFHPSDASESRPRVVKRKQAGRKKSDSDDDDDEEDDASEVESATSEDSDDEPKKRKKSKKVANNKPKGKPPGRRGRKPAAETEKKAPPTPAAAKKGNRKRDHESSEESEQHADENASSSEDEPLIKKAKSPQPPTDEEIKKYVKEILDGANLEEITMKTVCKQVYAHYPDFDLAHKKEFIKDTVKSLIST